MSYQLEEFKFEEVDDSRSINDQVIDRSRPRRLSDDSLKTPNLDRIHELTHHPHIYDYKY